MGWGAAIAGIIGAGAQAYGASQSGGQSTRRAVRQAAQGGVQALNYALPAQLGYAQAYAPMFNALGESQLDRYLFGGPAESGSVSFRWRDGRYLTEPYDVPETQGVVNILGGVNPYVQQMQSDAERLATGQGLYTLASYLPAARALDWQADPDLFNLRNNLAYDADRQLGLGGKLNPEDVYNITSSARRDWANRGLGQSDVSQLSEALQLYAGGQQARQSRQQYATDVASKMSMTRPDYMKFVQGLGQNSSLANTYNIVNSGIARNYNFDPYNPINPSSTTLGSLGAQLQFQGNQDRASLYTGIGSGLLDLAGTLYKNSSSQQNTTG